MLNKLAGLLKSNGRMIVEVPSVEDAFLTLNDCDAFQRFTYWSQHLFLFNMFTLAASGEAMWAPVLGVFRCTRASKGLCQYTGRLG